MVARGLRGFRGQAADGGSGLTGESRASGPAPGSRKRASATVMQGDRRKAYRPIPPDRRRAALEAGLAAYERGNFFEAHELLEPAWMGTSDLAERALYQGLIKLAAGYVHAVRGNPTGVALNLRGARGHLETSLRLDPDVATRAGIDVALLMAQIDARLTAVATIADALATGRGRLIDLIPEAPPVR
jgi:predicted metal-dependent hydrolase